MYTDINICDPPITDLSTLFLCRLQMLAEHIVIVDSSRPFLPGYPGREKAFKRRGWNKADHDQYARTVDVFRR